MNNNFYILKCKDDLPMDIDKDPWYKNHDTITTIVVEAKNTKEARELANEAGGKEVFGNKDTPINPTKDPWLKPRFTTCKKLIIKGESEVVCRGGWAL